MDNDYLYWQDVSSRDEEDDAWQAAAECGPEPDEDPVAWKAYWAEIERDSKAAMELIRPELEADTAIYRANEANAIAELDLSE